MQGATSFNNAIIRVQRLDATRAQNILDSHRASGPFFMCWSGIGSSQSLLLALKFAWHWVPAEWNTPGDKIALVFQCAAFAVLPAVVAICVVAAQRLNPKMWVGRTAKPNSALDINTRFILNTFEQFTAYLVAIAVVALYSPPEGARALPILTARFVVGRILFRVGYHKHPYFVAFGFGTTVIRRLQSISGLSCSLCSASAYRCSNQRWAGSIAERGVQSTT